MSEGPEASAPASWEEPENALAAAPKDTTKVLPEGSDEKATDPPPDVSPDTVLLQSLVEKVRSSPPPVTPPMPPEETALKPPPLPRTVAPDAHNLPKPGPRMAS